MVGKGIHTPHEQYHYRECMRHLNVRIGEHICISPLTRKQVKPKNSSVGDHLLLCNHSASYDDFSILKRENKKFLLELKESLLIMRDKPFLNRNIKSASLYVLVIRSLLEFYLLLKSYYS